MKPESLSSSELIFISISTMIGTGLFIVLPYTIELMGPYSWFAWLGVSILSVLTSLTLAELASTFPEHGIYNFVKKAFGELMGFLTGWTSLIIAWITVGILVGGGIHYLTRFFVLSQPLKVIFSSLLLVGFTLMNLAGVKSSVKLQVGLTGFVMVLFGLILCFSLTSVELGRLPRTPENVPSILLAATVVMEPFIVWEVLFLSDRVKNPKIKLPKVLVISTLVVSVFYLLTSVVMIGTGKPSLLELSKEFFGKSGEEMILALVVGVILSSANSWIISSPWIPFSMAKDLLLPSTFAKLNDKGVPENSFGLQLIVVTFIAALGTYKQLLYLLVPLAIIVYILLLLSYLRLKGETEKKGRFRVPSGKLLAAFLIVGYFLLFLNVNWLALLEGLLLVSISIPFYIQIKIQTDKKFAERVKDYTYFINRKVKGMFWAHSQEAADLLTALAKVRTKDSVLDYGGNVSPKMGKLTEKINVTALCISKKELMHSKKEISKLVRFPNIIWIKEEEKYVPFEEELFDVVLSIGGLNYTSKPGFILKKLYQVLKPKGRIALLIIDNLLEPAPHVIDSKEEIEEEFKKYDFKDINVIVKRTFFSTYFIVKGRK